jgi:hypothetical protein
MNNVLESTWKEMVKDMYTVRGCLKMFIPPITSFVILNTEQCVHCQVPF